MHIFLFHTLKRRLRSDGTMGVKVLREVNKFMLGRLGCRRGVGEGRGEEGSGRSESWERSPGVQMGIKYS